MKSLDVEELLQSARERTGLSDFGPAHFKDDLHALVNSINASALISRWDDLGDLFMRLLMNRLWFAKDLAEHPEILEQDPGSPVVITSMPRTGSTKLHRMLGASGDFQTVRMWSGQMFARIPGLPDGGVARRIQETREFEKWMYETSPEILTGHPMFTDEPEEDYLLGAFTFRHSFFFGVFNIPEYSQWLMQADMRPTYDYFLQQIQYLQWQFDPQGIRPWLFKTPCHFGYESELFRIFENPKFIVTHRDPAKVIPSITNTTAGYRKLYSDHDTTANISAGTTEYFVHNSLQHMKWRDSNPNVEILDLSFREINDGGMGAARKVYEFLGMPLSADAEENMRKWEQDHRQGKHGKNVYSAEAIGTTDSDIRKAFAAYAERFSEFL